MTEHSGPPVVVGIDGSPAATEALRWAVRTAARYRAPLHLVYAVGAPVDFGPALGVVAFDNSALRADGDAVLATAAATAREQARGLEITCTVADPAPATVLIGRSKDARMVVAGTRGLGAIGRGLLGSVSAALARHAHCPVTVVPDPGPVAPDLTGRPIVVGVDGSACSAEAVEIAFEEAYRLGVGLIAVTTWSEFFHDRPRAEMQRQARELQVRSLAARADWYPDVPVTHIVAADRPARRILEEADRAQLVIVGSHGRGGFAGMTLGSVGQAVLHGARVPVMLTRPRT
ncbi:universal stress protein [Nocardia sp. NPDC003963]